MARHVGVVCVGLLVIAATLGSCRVSIGTPGSPSMPASARSECPGSVPVALSDLDGTSADTVERLQRTFEGRPGFLAVIFDGAMPIVVVEAQRLPEWQSEVGSSGITVAPSCVDPALLAAVLAVVPTLAPPDRVTSAGYDAIRDAIRVVGLDGDTLLAALDKLDPAMSERARTAIGAGTLVINGPATSDTGSGQILG